MTTARWRIWFVDPEEIAAVMVDETTGFVSVFLRGHAEPIAVCDPVDRILPAITEARYCRFCRQEIASRPTNVIPEGYRMTIETLRALHAHLGRVLAESGGSSP
jgi:hypothetical protein